MPTTSNYLVYPDANAPGGEAHVNLNGEKICHKLWDTYESTHSPNTKYISQMVHPQQSSVQHCQSGQYENGFTHLTNKNFCQNCDMNSFNRQEKEIN